jgi:hypothetical protein
MLYGVYGVRIVYAVCTYAVLSGIRFVPSCTQQNTTLTDRSESYLLILMTDRPKVTLLWRLSRSFPL